MHLHALGQQIQGRFITDLVSQRGHAACGAHHGFLTLHQQLDHVGCARHAFRLAHAGELLELLVGARCREAQRTDTLGDQVHRQCEFVVLRLEHQVQGVEHRAGHVPVKVVRGQVQRVAVGEQAGQPVGDGSAIVLVDADIDFHTVLLVAWFSQSGTDTVPP
ncbi:hypothetical protein SDC9_204214 [bioreactor metagenome]|uniref:Uncharacterized protein n=1 Tax=bioreactor metagenome TaxID=1076179 RepID=A0A645J7S5_9ZZZZ